MLWGKSFENFFLFLTKNGSCEDSLQKFRQKKKKRVKKGIFLFFFDTQKKFFFRTLFWKKNSKKNFDVKNFQLLKNFPSDFREVW